MASISPYVASATVATDLSYSYLATPK